MAKEKPGTENLNNSLKRLAEITEWFDNQEEIDVEEGLKKVKEAVGLINVSKERLKTIENEFEEIKKGIDGEEDKSSSPTELSSRESEGGKEDWLFDFATARESEESKLSSSPFAKARESNYLDYFDVLIAALPKKTVDPYISCLKKANLKPLALEIESLAIARALIKNEATVSPVLLIDLGETRTGFVVFSGNSLKFTSSIPVSSQSFTEIISKALKINPAEAEELKIQYGLQTDTKKKGSQVFEALIPALSDLIEQIKRYLNYYQTHASHEHLPPDGKGVAKILLCGGGANLKGLPLFLNTYFKIPVEIGNPWINILPEPQKEAPELPLEKSLSYTTALGLALRGLK